MLRNSYPFVYLSVCLSLCLSVCVSVCLSACLYVCLSTCLLICRVHVLCLLLVVLACTRKPYFSYSPKQRIKTPIPCQSEVTYDLDQMDLCWLKLLNRRRRGELRVYINTIGLMTNVHY